MHIKKPNSLLAAALLSTILAGAAFNAAQAQSITIYDLESLTGPAQGVGVPQANAMKLAADQINAKGGIKVGNQSTRSIWSSRMIVPLLQPVSPPSRRCSLPANRC